MPDLAKLADDLNQAALTGSDAQLAQLIETTPISPPHGQAKNLSVKKAVPKLSTGIQKDPFGKAKITDVLAQIAFIKFRAVKDNTDGQVGALTFDVKYATELTTTASRTGWIPCWFLPWKSGLLVKFTITSGNAAIASGDVSIADLPNPRLFITAAINGCSVFAYGSTKGPTVVHAGFESNFADKEIVRRDLGGNSATMWRALLQGVVATEDGLKVSTKVKPNLGEINRYDYVSAWDGQKDQIGETPEARAFLKYLQTSRRQLQVKEVGPWGSVYGLRSAGGDWRMTLQRNATIQYRMYEMKKGLFSSKTVDVGPHVDKPATKGLDKQDKERITKKYEDTLKTNQFVSVVNLGHTDFFPGPNQIASHSHHQIVFW